MIRDIYSVFSPVPARELLKPAAFPEWWAGRASVVIHHQPRSTTLEFRLLQSLREERSRLSEQA